MNLESGDGDGKREDMVDMISIGGCEELEQLKEYKGKQMIFSINPDKTWWPSDTSLPLGRPSTVEDIYVLE